MVGRFIGRTNHLQELLRQHSNAVDNGSLGEVTEITEPVPCRSLRFSDNRGVGPSKIIRLVYTNSGVALLALASNAVHKLWKWQQNESNPSSEVLHEANASVSPRFWQPSSGILMINDIGGTDPEEAVSCFALSKNDSYVISASGGKVSLFNMLTFNTMTTFLSAPPVATYLAFHPQDNNIIAIGMEDSTIQIYNVRIDEVKSKLRCHEMRITGLAFSLVLNVLVSSGADAQICVWGMDEWEKQNSKFLQIQEGRVSSVMLDTRVQFHEDQMHFLAVHETQLAIFEATNLELLYQWVPSETLPASISDAIYSCDSQLIFATFANGAIGIFHAETLRPTCCLSPSAYIPSRVSSGVYPLVVAAHPSKPNQFAVGLSDGSIQVLEPLESQGTWSSVPPTENGSGVVTSGGPTTGNSLIRWFRLLIGLLKKIVYRH